ncbi:MAG: GNAT family N-acetyltransferase [Candidatus Saccharimonadales bacterium]
MTHNNYILKPHDYTYYDYGADEYVPLDFTNLCAASGQENMLPLSPEGIAGHALGRALVESFWSPHNVQHIDVIGYAGATGFRDFKDEKHMVIGGVITLPEYQNKGLGSLTIMDLLDAASTPDALAQFRHAGFIARCNPASTALLGKLGFEQAGEEGGKTLMVKPIELSAI